MARLTGPFNLQISQFAERAGRNARRVIETTLLDLSKRVILRTPVGNPDLWHNTVVPPGYVGGQARANWQSSIARPATGTLDTEDATGTTTINNVDVSNAPGNVWYLTNNLPYINQLEYDGWSTQAPEGMVRVTIAELDQAIARATAALRR
jgi:hypothetical protein